MDGDGVLGDVHFVICLPADDVADPRIICYPRIGRNRVRIGDNYPPTSRTARECWGCVRAQRVPNIVKLVDHCRRNERAILTARQNKLEVKRCRGTGVRVSGLDGDRKVTAESASSHSLKPNLVVFTVNAQFYRTKVILHRSYHDLVGPVARSIGAER